jgi:hypothetical protein
MIWQQGLRVLMDVCADTEWACSCSFAPIGIQGEARLRGGQDYRHLNSVAVKNWAPIRRILIDDLLHVAPRCCSEP